MGAREGDGGTTELRRCADRIGFELELDQRPFSDVISLGQAATKRRDARDHRGFQPGMAQKARVIIRVTAPRNMNATRMRPKTRGTMVMTIRFCSAEARFSVV